MANDRSPDQSDDLSARRNERALASHLRALASVDAEPAGEASAHPDEDALARFVDGVASTEERDAVEQHLAQCGACRAEVMATIETIESSESSRARAATDRSGSRGPFRWLAAAAALLVPLWFWWPSAGPSEPFQMASYDGLPSEIEQSMRSLLEQQIWEVGTPVVPNVSGTEAIERSSQRADIVALEPLRERSSARPSFAFAVATGANVGSEATALDFDLLLLDENESVVGSWSASAPASSDPDEPYLIVTTQLDAAASNLEPGQLYLWRVTTRIDSQTVASQWTPFRIRTEEERHELQQSLRGERRRPVVRAALLAQGHYYREAVDQVLSAGRDSDDRERARILGAGLYEQLGVPQSVARSWVQHLEAGRRQ